MTGQRVKRTPPAKPAVEKPSKDEYAVANYMREKVPRKKTRFMHHPVEYFTAARAVDALLDSPWASGAEKKPILFTDRESVVAFLDDMLRHKFFHRAKKLAISDRDLRRKQLKKLKKKEEEERKHGTRKEDEEEEGKRKESESEHDERRAEDSCNADETGGERSAVEGEPGTPKAGSAKEPEKPKRRIKLDMHLEQVFVDGTDAYVWIYDPIPTYYWLLGALIVAAIVAVCLFPLWPSKMREGVYYLSLAAAGFLLFILVLAVFRVIVYCLLWVLTWGRHQLWLLPNLTEDVGFFASFWPLYQYEYKGKKSDSPEGKKKKKTEKHVEIVTEKDDSGKEMEKEGANQGEVEDPDKEEDEAKPYADDGSDSGHEE